MSENLVNLHIGERIAQARRLRGWSLQAVAREVGVTYQQIRKYELGQNRIAASTLYQLAKVLQLDPGYFFHGLSASGGESADGFDAALQRINDPLVRQRMADLAEVLQLRSDASLKG
ncbi:helix-turn-helix transcriptional regulator [Aureimonas sp. ME7]|uniref:helix-turn-helix domain-containing protein n=1 Tax=Aureimonas sp. ME7 TaxID=2744252 RepID=UPI0015F4834C|nr:helix-turn-helix transcriptional regulator [Aureimonas sp. ME7]